MLGKKTAAILVVVSLLIGLEISKIYVPDEFERPFFYKFKFVMVHSLGKLATFSASLNYGIEAANYRNLLRSTTYLLEENDPDINKVDTKISNINVRIYSQVSNNEKNLPVMVYFHGGGYTFGDLETYESYLIQMVKRLNIIVISVDYGLVPEHPYPSPTTECYTVAEYVLRNAAEFNGDSKRVILAGDSAGGNAVAVVSQKLLASKKNLPKLQILIYPWTQMFNVRLPSYLNYSKDSLISTFTLGKHISWYLGIDPVTKEIEDFINFNNHTALIKDVKLRNKLKSYVDVNLIPKEYKVGKSYYKNYDVNQQYPSESSLDAKFLERNKNIINRFLNIFSNEFSPCLAEPEQLKGLPNAYVIVCEWDKLKDEGLIYAERLRREGVPVKVAFYEKCFHGVSSMVTPVLGYQVAQTMLEDAVEYIRANI